jgi:hypothetical protein
LGRSFPNSSEPPFLTGERRRHDERPFARKAPAGGTAASGRASSILHRRQWLHDEPDRELGKAMRFIERANGFVHRPKEHGPNQKTDLKADGDWDVTGNSMIEVAKKLGC